MGDLRVCSSHDSDVMEDRLNFPATLFSPTPDPSLISDEAWSVAEGTTHDVVLCIHPTLDSEEKRKDVIDYIQRLIRGSLGCEVFPYGSVPLKTYLPDGDIDLTALSSPNIEESLARDVLAVLREEEHNENAQFELKDTQFIDAEVKLVKCLVENIVIDISFNQLGGLRTLCFLEQVDRLVGKDHLFKRSIILIKAWCYYESRILGAHHGLISTYALETLVLYIFHLFNSSLSGPLSVFYKFLDYFSKFDWETYCISLNGPAHKSSLPNIVVEKPGNGQDELMLSEEFLRNCIEMFSVQSRELEDMRAFPQKHLNIIDPLKENNNLGRSVHRGNYYRICSAFKYGARKLGQILLLPTEKIPHEIKKFFSNTLNRHGHAYGPNLKNDTLLFGVEALYKDDLHSESSSMDLDEDISEMDDIPEVEDNIDLGYRHKVDKCSNELVSSEGFHASGDNQVNGNACQNNDSKSFSLDFREGDAVNGEIDALNPLSDLSGDYDSHIRSLLYGQCCHGYALSAHSPRGPTSPTPRHHFHNKLNSFSRKNSNWVGPSTNGVSSASHVYPASNIPASPHASFGLEENQKSRGTGTFIPIVMQGSCSCSSKGRPSSSQGRGRWDQLHKDMRRKCVLPPPRESDLFVNGRHDVQSTDSTINGNSSKPHNLNINGFSNSYTVELEFGSITTVVHTNIKLNSNGRSSISNVVGSEGQHSKLVLGKNKQRSSSAFRLKNEDEFPPLSA